MKQSLLAGLAATGVLLSGVVASAAEIPKEATKTTKMAQERVLNALPFSDQQDFEDARRGFIAAPTLPLRDEKGVPVWNLAPYEFLKREQAPDTVNPSLWRQARLNMEHGLYKVTDRIYQVRGLDLSNMTLVEGDTGLIVIDSLLSKENAAAALELYYAQVPAPDGKRRPIKAVIYSHSHADHYGGVKGVIDEKDVQNGNVAVLAPEGFLEEAVSENVLAGNAMKRRGVYMYGALLPRGEKGQVDAGLGKTTSSGTTTLIPPTDTIRKTGETRTIDGVVIEFQMAPGTEAPAEMLLYFPQFKALCAAEDATHTLHNLYTLRGAKVRDAAKWWRTLDETVDLFADRSDIVFAQHHWPRWGKESVRAFLTAQRDGYKFLHDQTLRLANQGYTPLEISEQLALSPSLARQWHLRDYYGTVSHNVKAVYQFYLGWYDGNPAHLHPLPPSEAGARYVEFMGGTEAVIEKARASFAKGEYRWVAEVMNHVVFAAPDNKEARALQADALEQLGYQAESGPWRNEYLMGARELREGIPTALRPTAVGNADTAAAMTTEMMLDFMSVHLNAPRAEGKLLRINWKQPNSEERYTLTLENSVLLYKKDRSFEAPDATLTLSRNGLMAVVTGRSTMDEELKSGRAYVEGNAGSVTELFGVLDTFDPMFPIVTP